MDKKIAVIIGAGPAGLTAGYEFLKKTDIKPVMFEQSSDIGGISRTVNNKGNLVDIGPHRYFSKSKRVVDMWFEILPLQGAPAKDDILLKRAVDLSEKPGAPDPEKDDRVMLMRSRVTRIIFLNKYFDYPLSFSMKLFVALGLKRFIKNALSYLRIKIFPIKNERSLEDFYVNRFGRELYGTFFADYSEKLWGIPCKDLDALWGKQRVKGVSVLKALLQKPSRILPQKKTGKKAKIETSLITSFLFPKLGSGHIWKTAADIIVEKGGEVYLNKKATSIQTNGTRVTGISVRDEISGITKTIKGDYFISTMPVKELIASMDPAVVPDEVSKISRGLLYRGIIVVNLVLRKLAVSNDTGIRTINNIIPDNAIYVQEPSVRLGRIQIFNNWSPYLVADMNTVSLGLEYYCNENEAFWNQKDEEIVSFAVSELEKLNIIDRSDAIGGAVFRTPKAYPVYSGTYHDFDKVRKFVDKFENLFLIGRNGMHRYNNMDHSALSAMVAVDNIEAGIKDKKNIWEVDPETVHQIEEE